MKSTIRRALTVILATALLPSIAVADKVSPPPPEKMKKLSFPAFKEFTTDNGIDVIVVEHHEQPVVSINFLIEVGDAHDPVGKEILATWVADQLNKGTKTRSSLELAEWIESVGGSVETATDRDYSAISVSVLSDYVDIAYEYLQDIVLNPVFPEDETELFRKRMKTALEFELSDPAAMARRHLQTLVFGDHPYAKQPTVESVEAIMREDLVQFHERNYVPNNVLVAVVGDVKWKDVRKALERYFGEWQTGSPDQVSYKGIPAVDKTEIFLYHRPGAVQTEIHIGHTAPKPDDPDWPAIVVGNQVLGASADSRLFMNIRETKGWTYRVRSRFSRERDHGLCHVFTPVRTGVTDSALVEVMAELERIRTEPVTQEELANAKSYLIGNFPITIETPGQIAAQVVRYKMLGFGKKELETYRDRIAAVTVDDVRRVMSSHLHPDRARIVLVGDATEIGDKVAAVANVNLYDIAGEPLSLASLSVEPVEYDYDTSKLQAMKATYGLSAMQMDLGELSVNMDKKENAGEEVIEVTSTIAGMLRLDEHMEFRAADLSPVSFKMNMQAGPQTLGAEFAFTEDGVSGTVQSPDAKEPKEVAFTLVDGVILEGCVEYALRCLPLEVDRKYRFPVVSTQTGTLQNLDAEIIEVTEVETGAGTFGAYKVKLKRPEGEAFLYIGAESPHVLLKQEVPHQQLTIVLKSLENK